MTVNEKIAMVKALANDSELTDELVTVYLTKAESSIRNRMYPFNLPKDDSGQEIPFEVPPKYEIIQCELACEYILRRGGEGEINHSENGINRSYESANAEHLLREVIQVIM